MGRLGNSQMHGNSEMYGNSQMSGSGIAYHPSHIVCADMVGTECSCLTVHPDTKIGIRVNRGCFSGSVSEFLAAVAKKDDEDPWKNLYPQILRPLILIVAKMLELHTIERVPRDKVKESVNVVLGDTETTEHLFA